MLSKETGVMLLPGVFCLCLAMESARHNTPLSLAHFRQSLTQNGKALIAILAVTVVYIALRLGFASVSYLDYRETAAGGIWNNLFLALESLKFYFHQALFPFATMTPRHPIVYVVSAWSPADILGNLATLAALAILVFYALRRQSAAAWVFLAGICYLALALHIVPIPIAGNLGHERFLSAPLAFWSMAAVLVRWEQIFAMPFMQKFAAGMNVLSPRLIAQMAAGAWLAMFAWTTHTTIPLWQDDLALWSWARQQFPDDKFSRYNYFRTMTLIDLETAKRAADFLKQETGFLYADEAILYASILLDNGDEKSFDYLKQVQQTAGDSLDMHRQPDAESLREKLSPMEASVISKYYALSAMAYFRFHKNPATALQLNEAALWYKQRTERDIGAKGAFGINVYKTAYLYGMGFFDTANKLRDELAASNGIEKEKINKLIQPILDNYCQFPESTEEKKAENPLLLVCDGIKVSMNQ
ncbi:MAG: hypothetical protein LBI68_01175 [Azoarcus sp.]|nr:hypothetical protein [Azoarcus sp.]